MHNKALSLVSVKRKNSNFSGQRRVLLGMTLLAAASLFSLTARAEIEIAPDFPVSSSKDLPSSEKSAAELLKSYLRDVQPENAGLSAESSTQKELKISLAE